MLLSLPFQTSRNNYRIVVPLRNVPFIFDVRWNTRDLAWYFDIREEDETPILCNNRVSVGAKPGHASNHPFFKTRTLQVIDTSDRNVDAGYDDLGERVHVLLIDTNEDIP